jgi:hypothetical protein
MSVISCFVTAAVNTLKLVAFTCSNMIENAVLYYVVQTLPRLLFYNQNDVWFHGTLVNVISLCPKEKHNIPGADCHKTYKRITLLHATCFISFTHLRT